MDDLDVLARDIGFGSRGKSNPMRSVQPDRRPIDDPLFSNVFGGPAKYTPSSNLNNNSKHSSVRDFDYDSIFNSSATASEVKKTSNSSSKTSSFPVYDKPVYDEDIFNGLPGLKSKSATSNVRFDYDVFASISSPPLSKGRSQNSDFDDLLGNLGSNEKDGEAIRSNSAKSSSSSKGLDDFLAGIGRGSSAAINSRQIPESSQDSVPAGGSKHGNALDDPFVVLGSSQTQRSSSAGVFTDPLEEISKLGKAWTKAEDSSGGSGGFDDLDPLTSFRKPAHSSLPGRDKREKEGGPLRSATTQSANARERMGNSSFRYSERNIEKKVPVANFQESPSFDVPNVSTDFRKSFGQTSYPQYFETGSHIDSATSEEQTQESEDIWLTVSEVPLFTQPTAAAPPSRPPPPIPRQTRRLGGGSIPSRSRKKSDEFSSPPNHSQHFESPRPARPAAKGPPVSQFDELEDFAIGRSQSSIDESGSLHSGEETNAFSVAAASAAAMKDAMEKAEAKFRHIKGVREREYAKAGKHKESVQPGKDEQDGQESGFEEAEERLEHEKKQREEEEREQRRLDRERERSRAREIERERARQAVERANREARERAAAEARSKAERAAVEKASAEARERAERAAVQRAQAEARERAAAEAKERAEKAAEEARERAAATEAREKVEARRRAERVAVERAAAEARERAAAEARERAAAAAAAKMNQQRKDDDLESFFGVGQANSADPFFDQPFRSKGESEAAKRWSSSSGAGASSNMKKASSTTNIVDDLSSIFGASPSSGEFQEVEGETEERRRARLERHQRTQERAAQALAEKNQRDLQAQREQDERHRIAETLDIDIKRWAAGREGNLRALLSTLQYVLWPECGWQPVSLTDLITGASVKKVYRKATLCIHPDKVQQKGATLQQKYIAEKVFDLLKEAWNKFNSEELF